MLQSVLKSGRTIKPQKYSISIAAWISFLVILPTVVQCNRLENNKGHLQVQTEDSIEKLGHNCFQIELAKNIVV